ACRRRAGPGLGGAHRAGQPGRRARRRPDRRGRARPRRRRPLHLLRVLMALTTPTTPTLPPDEASAPPRPSRVWRPFAIAAVALVLAALLNADELQRTAEHQPVGWERDVLVDLVAVPQEVADASGLNRPRRWAESLLGRQDPGAVAIEHPAPPPARPPGGTDAPDFDATDP